MSARVWKFMLGFYIALFFAFLFGPLAIMGVTAFNTPSYPQVWPFEGFTIDEQRDIAAAGEQVGGFEDSGHRYHPTDDRRAGRRVDLRFHRRLVAGQA